MAVRPGPFHPTVLISLILSGLLAGPLGAATIVSYESEEGFRSALPPATLLVEEDFDSYEAGTIITTQVSGVVFSSPAEGGEGYSPIRVFASAAAVSPPNLLFGGFDPTDEGGLQIFRLAFDGAVQALAFQLAAQDPAASAASVFLVFDDETSRTLDIGDTDGIESTPEFFGVTSDTPILYAVVTSGREDGGEGGFEEFGIDDLIFSVAGEDDSPPLCSGRPSLEVASRIDATATDDREGDSGIATVELGEDAFNLLLEVDPYFSPGDGSVMFSVRPADGGLDAGGHVIVTDGAGLTCTLGANFRALDEGPTDNVTICTDEGILFSVSNDESTPAGTATCSSTVLTPEEPPLPPGYESSPAADPFPCRVLTIESPIAGDTRMIYKKDGTYDPRLRLLFARSLDGGLTFPPFTDVTESVEPILTVDPDPTRLSGGVKWSPVKVACALQAEICDGLDNDGDGLVDEGLPVGGPVVDADADGWALCPAAGVAPDCNDQLAVVFPGAVELCDGLDDDCDGLIDEDDPGGGASCDVDGLLGACALGATECVDGALVCRQTVEPSDETCDGVDNDCDGSVDEIYLFGGYQRPVREDGSSVFRRRSTVPFKFQLTDCSGAIVADAVATLRVFFYASGVVGSELEDVSSPGQANDDNLYRYDPVAQQYIYNLSTSGLAPSTSYVVRTTLDDGSTHDVIISIR